MYVYHDEAQTALTWLSSGVLLGELICIAC